MQYAVAVFDVGKTNKKVMIYDDRLGLVDSVYRAFPTEDRDGVEIEPIEKIAAWLRTELAAFGRRYPIRAVSVTTHGAAFACLDRQGRLALPVVSYTHEPGDAFHEEFYRLAGAREELQRSTATLELKALINPAQGIFFARKTRPREFESVESILLYPQFWGYLLTGKKAADLTYAGCHTYLWDFRSMTWSSVADRLKIRELLPERVAKPWEVLGNISPEIARETGLSPDTIVTMGIHDSNASLLPYLLQMKKDFVLNSTGTWCVAMHPMDRVFFTDDEIGKSVFYNLSAFGTPVKTAFLMGGLESETYTELFRKLHGAGTYPEIGSEVYAGVLRERQLFILPGVVKGSGQFPDSEPRVFDHGSWYPLAKIRTGEAVPPFFRDYPRALAVLNLSLAIQTRVALERVGLARGVEIFTEGGFRNNMDYNTLLRALSPGSPAFLTDLKEATSFGAALVGKAAREGIDVRTLRDTFEISVQEVPDRGFPGLPDYRDAFLRLL